MLELICIQLDTQGAPLHISGVLFLCSTPPLWYSVLQTPSASSTFQNQLFPQFSLLGFTWVSCHASCLGNSFRAVSLVIITIGLISSFSSSGFTAFHWLISCLENYCFIYCPSLVVSGMKVDLVTVTPSWQEVEGSSPPPQPPLVCS